MARTPNRLVTVALAATLAIAAGGVTDAKPKPRKPKPKPRLELLTPNQLGAVRRGAIKIEIRSKRGAEARLRGTLFVDGFPDDFYFRLGPRTGPLKGKEAIVSLPLSARKREVLDFAAQTCRPAGVDATVKVGRGRASLSERLKKPPDCG
jgi:hypothetical protein